MQEVEEDKFDTEEDEEQEAPAPRPRRRAPPPPMRHEPRAPVRIGQDETAAPDANKIKRLYFIYGVVAGVGIAWLLGKFMRQTLGDLLSRGAGLLR